MISHNHLPDAAEAADRTARRARGRTFGTIASIGVAGLLLAGCSATASLDSGTAPAEIAASADVFSGDLSPAEVLAANADYTTVNESEWSEADAVDIALKGSSATSSGTGVEADGASVTITAAGVYRLSGSLEGSVVVAAPEDALVVLILDRADISNDAGPAIEIQSADDVAIHLASGSDNRVSDAASYADDATANAAIDAKTDLTISGEGSLAVAGNGNDGIASTDDLVVLSGSLTVIAADDALRGKDALVIEGGTLDLTATAGDGLKSDQEDDEARGYILMTGGTLGITAGDDGVQAQTDTVITGGTLTVAAADDGVKAETVVSIGGGDITVSESTEGIEANYIGIFDGVIDVTASDDGLNASGINQGGQERETDTGERLEISGGTVTVHAGVDGLDSNGTVTISGGVIDITSADMGGDAPIDANGEVTVSGGTVTANGVAYDPAAANVGPGGMSGGPGGGAPGGGAPGGGAPGGGAPDGAMPGEGSAPPEMSAAPGGAAAQ